MHSSHLKRRGFVLAACFAFLAFVLSTSAMVASKGGQVFVCTNKYCREKGSEATLATFTSLAPPTVEVRSVSCLGRCNQGPNCKIYTFEETFVEASMVRSVETVVDLLQRHLRLDVNLTSAEVLRLNYEGNVYLRNGDADKAIECYDKALVLRDPEQEGVLLVMRGTALLQRAYLCRMRHRDVIALAEKVLPTIEGLRTTLEAFSTLRGYTSMKASLELLLRVAAVFNSLDYSPAWAERKAQWPESREGGVVSSGDELIGRAQYTLSLYEHALMRALQDLLSATLVVPGFFQAWRRAGDALLELRQFHSAKEYYQAAIDLNDELKDDLQSVIERLKVMDRLVANAEAQGWPMESIISLIDE